MGNQWLRGDGSNISNSNWVFFSQLSLSYLTIWWPLFLCFLGLNIPIGMGFRLNSKWVFSVQSPSLTNSAAWPSSYSCESIIPRIHLSVSLTHTYNTVLQFLIWLICKDENVVVILLLVGLWLIFLCINWYCRI